MRLPLHGKATPVERADYWMKMQALTPKGFAQAPTSRKNRKFHAKGPVTRMECIANTAYGK